MSVTKRRSGKSVATESATLLDVFAPPVGQDGAALVGHSAILVSMTASEDFLDMALERFTGLRARQRRELGLVVAYLMLDAHESAARREVLPPGRVPGLHELQPRTAGVSQRSLLHSKIALLGFAPRRTAATPTCLRLAVLTANLTQESARRQLELVFTVDVPVGGREESPAQDRADVVAAMSFVEELLKARYHPDEAVTKRLAALLHAAEELAPAAKTPRFFHSLEKPLLEQIRLRFGRIVKSPRNLLLCGSGFYEAPSKGKAQGRKPTILAQLEKLDILTTNARRVALVEPGEAGAVEAWASSGEVEGWTLSRPVDALTGSGLSRKLHAKFIYAGHCREGALSNGCLYLGSGNLTRRGLVSTGKDPVGNIECGVVVPIDERFEEEEIARKLFWSDDARAIGDDEWQVGRVGDAPDDEPLLVPPPILSASVETGPPRTLRLAWRDDVEATTRVTVAWTGRPPQAVDTRQATVPLDAVEAPSSLVVRDESLGRLWTVPVVDPSGRVSWTPPRYDSFEDALAALLDFPLRSAEESDDPPDDDEAHSEGSPPDAPGAAPGAVGKPKAKVYALHAAAELLERVAELQQALQYDQVDDWIDHLDRTLATALPASTIAAWREAGIDVLSHLRARELAPPDLSALQRSRYAKVLDRVSRMWRRS